MNLPPASEIASIVARRKDLVPAVAAPLSPVELTRIAQQSAKEKSRCGAKRRLKAKASGRPAGGK